MVEVFKTNVQQNEHAAELINVLHQAFPGNKINFDLDDCDKVLRIEGHSFICSNIIRVLQERGFYCNILE
ncbi:hypothetical protein I5907_16555 [Panacibacter sp. DH6]|uniref:Uncharacterized protein n=1 Tax=Panacibacter microcysteis TaxID=2793269 RepID=A0A931E6B5_9BACT|nr:hypothetical protein [Panacibacter microcysteis]MBG9377853.1 hypothetical protein [Panacibacter microcysteis]